MIPSLPGLPDQLGNSAQERLQLALEGSKHRVAVRGLQAHEPPVVLEGEDHLDLIAHDPPPFFLSVFDQTFQDWELIICDDASRDNTAKIAKQLAQVDTRVAYFKNTATQGLPGNRNIGISKAKSELILFIEDDVILEPDCVALLMETYEQLGSQYKIGAVAPSRPDEWLVDGWEINL